MSQDLGTFFCMIGNVYRYDSGWYFYPARGAEPVGPYSEYRLALAASKFYSEISAQRLQASKADASVSGQLDLFEGTKDGP